MKKRKLLIFTAVQLETRAVASGLGIERRPERGTYHYPGPDLDLYQIGVGAARLPSKLFDLSSTDHPFCGVIMIGLAGALDPSLDIGDVITDASPADKWEGLPFRRGLIHTSELLVATTAHKAALYQQTGALAVEMEGSLVRQLALALNVPLLSLRSISDKAGEALDPSVVGFVDEFGRARPLVAAAILMRRPRLIGPVVRLARNATRAAASLTAAVRWMAENDRLGPNSGSASPTLRIVRD